MRKPIKLIATGCLLLSFAVAGSVAVASGENPPAKKAGVGEVVSNPHGLWVYRQSVALGVPEGELSALATTCRDQGFTATEVRRVLGLIAKAKLAGLPHEDLLAKLREGLAKHARPETIHKALLQKAATLKKAKGLLDNLIMEGWLAVNYPLAIKVFADALDFGTSSQQLLSVVRGDIQRLEGMPDVSNVISRIEGK